MQAVSNTGRSGVLVLKVDEDDVNTVLMNTDIENDGSLKYAYDNFADAFSENILEYAFAYADIPRNQITKKQREAAQSLLKLHEIEKLRYYLEHDVPEEDWEPAFLRWYEKKGVLGEIVLHMFLKEFKNTIPLISKMYFKDSFSQEAKGFDAVHVSQDSLTLWLGETKFYKAWKTKGVVKGGIDELVEDLKKHITKDYLSEQYVIIKRGLETQLEHPQREEWIEKLSRPILLKDVFQYIRIPLLCIYEDDIALDYLKAIDDAVKDAGIVSHTATLRDYYNSINTFAGNRYEIRKKYWEYTLPQLKNAFSENGLFGNVNPVTSNWIAGFVGIPGIHIDCVANFDESRVELYLGMASKEKNKELFGFLFARKDNIEKVIGTQLIWSRMDDNKASKIHTFLPGVDISKDIDWPRMAKFHVDASKKLYLAFKEHLEQYFHISL